MDWKEILARSKKLFEDAATIFANPESTSEDKENAGKMVEDARKMRESGVQLKEIKMTAKELDDMLSKEEKQVPEIPEDVKKFADWVDFLTACAYAGFRDPSIRKLDPRLIRLKEENRGHETKQMVESVGASGGFLVPTEFLAQLQGVMAESAIVRSRATIIRMNRRQIDIPVLNQTGTTPTGRGHWFGGMLAYWAEEASEKTLTEATFRRVSLVAHKLIMYTRASDELLDDSAISLSDFLAGPLGFAGAIAWQEDFAFFLGTGAGQPLGVITAVNRPTIVVARAVAGAFGYADLVNMLERFLPSSTGLWTVTQNGLSDMMTIQDPNGSYIWQPNAREGVPQTLFGFPLLFNEKQPVVGQQGDVLLADWRYYLLGDRQATTVESTQFDQWALDQTSWRATHRVDGQPWLSAPLTYQDGATTVSPFVILGGVGS